MPRPRPRQSLPLAASLAFALLVGAVPWPGVAQAAEAEIERFEASPIALPPSGGVLTVTIVARSQATEIWTDVEVLSPDGRVAATERVVLVPQDVGRVGDQVGVRVEPDGRPGWWQVRIARAVVPGPSGEQTVFVSGPGNAPFFVATDAPAAGLVASPWPQSGGDAGHTGRTLAQGPSGLDVERWAFTSTDRQPFHSPVIAPDGNLYAVTWGGELYALTADGDPVWTVPFRFGSFVAFPPALTPNGNVIVAVEDGLLVAVRPDRTQAWRVALADAGDARAALSPPLVAPDGRVFVIREPWTLVSVAEDGTGIRETPLVAPAGLIPITRRVPAAIEGPALAFTAAGQVIVVSGGGLAIIATNGTIDHEIPCDCQPRSVMVLSTVALVGAKDEVTGIALATRDKLWSTDDLPATASRDSVWMPPAVDWTGNAYIAAEDGWLHVLTTEGTHQLSRDYRTPLRSQPVVDAGGNLYLADACRTIRSVTASGTPRWTYEIDAPACLGVAASPVITREGAILWPAPDGVLRMLGANRLPVAAFVARWDEDAYLFDATSSYDPDGAQLSVVWDFGDGTATGRGSIVRHAYATSGTYTVELTVSDPTGASTTVRPVVVDFAPDPVWVDQSRGFALELNASSTVDPEGAEVEFLWLVDGVERGREAVLRIEATEPRVYHVELVASDGERSARRADELLAPGGPSWRRATMVLLDGSECPARICPQPDALNFAEGDLVALRLVNGASDDAEMLTGLEAVLGGVAAAVVPAGEQRTLHFKAGPKGDREFTIEAVGTSRQPTRVPVEVRPAAASITWTLLPFDDAPRAHEPYPFRLLLEGTAPPDDVEMRATLFVALREVASETITLPAGEVVGRVVDLALEPAASGPLSVRVAVQSDDQRLASVQPAAGQASTVALDVLEPTFFSKMSRTISEHPLISFGLLGLLIVALLAFVAVRLRRAPADDATTTRRAPSTGDATVAATFLPRKLDRFQIDRVLGEGGFGRTYLAHDQVLGRRVVLKEVDAAVVGASHDILLHEARTAATLSHPNVVVVHDVIEEAGRLFIVMEYVEGGTLRDRLSKGPLPHKQTLTVLTDILQGLAALHAAGIVHRDLKPSNIVITHEGVAKITDFGVAARVEQVAGTDGGAFVGTPRYMAPEQLAGRAPGPPADLYAAGAVLYEMLLGKHHLGVGVEAVPDAHELLLLRSQVPVHGLDPHLNHVLERALAREPEKRFASAHEFLDALRRVK